MHASVKPDVLIYCMTVSATWNQCNCVGFMELLNSELYSLVQGRGAHWKGNSKPENCR